MRIPYRFAGVFCAASLALLLSSTSAVAALAYIGNARDKAISVIDTATNSVVATISLPVNVSGIAVSSDGKRVYAANGLQVFVIDTTTNVWVTAIGTGTRLYSASVVAIAPDGKRAYVTGASGITVLDTETNEVIARISGAYPAGVAVNPAGTRAYVANTQTNIVSVVDTASDSVIARIELAGTSPCPNPVPFGLAVTPDGTRIYVANANCMGPDGNWYTTVIDADRNEVLTHVASGTSPSVSGVAVNRDGTRAYVSNGAVIDTISNKMIATFPGSSMNGIALSPDGTRAYLPGDEIASAGSVSVIDTATNAVVTSVTVGGAPISLGQFVGPDATPQGPAVSIIEYYHAGFDHYFITWMPGEIAKLDAGVEIRGWARTGYSFKTYTAAQAGTSPVCRYYIPPALGDSHFFGRGAVECNETGQKNPSFILEDPAFMQMHLPVAGVCPAGTAQVYRVFSNRPDANHRYMKDRAVRDRMVAKGWLAEGDGPDLVVMCAPQ